MVDVKGRWALITGAARGIGYGAAVLWQSRAATLSYREGPKSIAKRCSRK